MFNIYCSIDQLHVDLQLDLWGAANYFPVQIGLNGKIHGSEKPS